MDDGNDDSGGDGNDDVHGDDDGDEDDGEDDDVDDDGAFADDNDGHDGGEETDEEVRTRRRAELLNSSAMCVSVMSIQVSLLCSNAGIT